MPRNRIGIRIPQYALPLALIFVILLSAGVVYFAQRIEELEEIEVLDTVRGYALGRNYEEYISDTEGKTTRIYYSHDVAVWDGNRWVPYTYEILDEGIKVDSPRIDLELRAGYDVLAGTRAEWQVEISVDGENWTRVEFTDWKFGVDTNERDLCVYREGRGAAYDLKVIYDIPFKSPVRAYVVYTPRENHWVRIYWHFENRREVLIPAPDNFPLTPTDVIHIDNLLVDIRDVEQISEVGSTVLAFPAIRVEEGVPAIFDPHMEPYPFHVQATYMRYWADEDDDDDDLDYTVCNWIPVRPNSEYTAWERGHGWWGTDWGQAWDAGMFSFDTSTFPEEAKITEVKMKFKHALQPKAGGSYTFHHYTHPCEIRYIGDHAYDPKWTEPATSGHTYGWDEAKMPFKWAQLTTGTVLEEFTSGEYWKSHTFLITDSSLWADIGSNNELVFSLTLKDWPSRYPGNMKKGHCYQYRGSRLKDMQLIIEFQMPTFSIRPDKSAVTLNPEEDPSEQVLFTIERQEGHDRNIDVSHAWEIGVWETPAPPGLSVSYFPDPATKYHTNITATITADRTAVDGTYRLYFLFNDGVKEERHAVDVTVRWIRWVELQAPATASVTLGGSPTDLTIVVYNHNYDGNLTFSVSGAPTSVTASWTPTSALSISEGDYSKSITLRLTPAADGWTGTAVLTVSATASPPTDKPIQPQTIELTVNPPLRAALNLGMPMKSPDQAQWEINETCTVQVEVSNTGTVGGTARVTFEWYVNEAGAPWRVGSDQKYIPAGGVKSFSDSQQLSLQEGDYIEVRVVLMVEGEEVDSRTISIGTMKTAAELVPRELIPGVSLEVLVIAGMILVAVVVAAVVFVTTRARAIRVRGF
jgi:hypothetical protein